MQLVEPGKEKACLGKLPCKKKVVGLNCGVYPFIHGIKNQTTCSSCFTFITYLAPAEGLLFIALDSYKRKVRM